MINLYDYQGKFLYYNLPYDLKSATQYAQTWTENIFYAHTTTRVNFLLKDVSLGIIVSDIEGELVARYNGIIGTQAKYMLESLNCW